MNCGVMVALGILVPSVSVRIAAVQHKRLAAGEPFVLNHPLRYLLPLAGAEEGGGKKEEEEEHGNAANDVSVADKEGFPVKELHGAGEDGLLPPWGTVKHAA